VDVDVNLPQNEGCTPLYMAASKGFVEIVRLLLQRDEIDIHVEYEGWTVMRLVRVKKYEEIVELLMEAGEVVEKEEKEL
jgi:ankyrin repeat protein